MSQDLTAQASVSIDAPISEVWNALTDPSKIKQYMYGAEVQSDWKEGSPIEWNGEFQGKKFKDKGKLLKIEPNKELAYTHMSSMSGEADVPENYHTVTYKLEPEAKGTRLTLSQDGNKSEKEKASSEEMWSSMLEQMKKVVLL
jgi:uncharacterized protein YndB with AHSA1/START domain